MWMHQFDECNDTKARNRLSLVDRVRAIKAYERTPIYQKVGLLFNCSAKQIRNIIKNKEKVLALYASGTKGGKKSPSKDDADEKRAKKIALLGKVMHEWFLRARRNPSVGGITYKLLQTVALEVKQHLNVENFYPNNAWLVNFRHSYNVSDIDMKASHSEEPGPTSLDIKEIIEFVNEKERIEMENSTDVGNSTWMYETPSWNDDSLASSTLHVPNSVATTSSRASSSSLYNDEQPPSKFPKLEPIDVIEVDDSDDDDCERSDTGRSRKPSAITTVEEALQHLKPLEDFALMKEDFRAIGLISQLEVILTNAKEGNTTSNSH